MYKVLVLGHSRDHGLGDSGTKLRISMLGSLLSADFVTEGQSVVVHGKPARGKTHLAIE